MDVDESDRLGYLMKLFEYDHPFNESYDSLTRESREYVDLQPAADPCSGRLLAFLVRLIGAKRVLELGTSIGYSAHWIAGALDVTDGELVTVDSHLRTGVEARRNFEGSGLAGRIRFINEDAVESLQKLKGEIEADKRDGVDSRFNLIFMDCGKSLYPLLLDDFYLLLMDGGLLVVDDTLFPVERGVRSSLAEKVNQFNQFLKADRRFYSVVLNVGHGLTLAWKGR